MIWAGWESWKEIWVCVNFPLTVRKDEAGTTNTQTRYDRSFWHSQHAEVDWTQRLGFHQQRRLGTFRTDESPGRTDSIVCMLTVRVLLWKTESGSACADDATRWGCPGFGGRVALCPLIVRCADSCQEMETASGWVKWLKLPCHVFYMSADEDGMEKTLISLSDRAHKTFGRGWIYCLFLIVPYPLAFPWQVSGKCYETAAAVCNVETTSHQGILWLPCFLLRFITLRGHFPFPRISSDPGGEHFQLDYFKNLKVRYLRNVYLSNSIQILKTNIWLLLCFRHSNCLL